MLNKHNPSELVFPLECHFRVIAENQAGLHFVIAQVLLNLGITAPVEPSNISGGGKYSSYNIRVVVESQEIMTCIDRELRQIKGVKMVL